MSSISLDSISNRLRYESISKLANESGKASSIEEIQNVLTVNAKFIVSAYQFLFLIFDQYDLEKIDHKTNVEIDQTIFRLFINKLQKKPVIYDRKRKLDNSNPIIEAILKDKKVSSVVQVNSINHDQGFIAFFSQKK